MKIKDILAKVAKGEDITDEEKSFLESYEEPDLDAVANARSKKERLKMEKQISELKTALEEKEAEIESANEGASELEKLQKQLEKANSKVEKANAELQAMVEQQANMERSSKLSGINIPWLDSVPQDYKKTVLDAAFKDIDTDDLSDGAVVKPIVQQIMESQSSLISSGAKGGAGSGAGEAGKSLESGKWTRERVQQAIADGSYEANREAILGAMAKGEIE